MIKRDISAKLQSLLKKYPIVALTGPRQSGKSTLLKHLLPNFQYVNLERPDIREFAENDPNGFLAQYSTPIILDEVQNVPNLFSYLQVIVDEKKEMGQFVLSGSSQFKLRESISQSLAGRVSIFNLLPLSINELKQVQQNLKVSHFKQLVKGFYPAIYDRNISSHDYYGDYLQTYIERDVRSLINVKDLKQFQRFLKLCAGRVGSLVNYTSIGNDLGLSRETIKTWLNVLEASYIAYELPPYYKNFNKRVIKSSKLYFYDTGLLSYILGVNEESIQMHPLKGGVFENYVINEFIKERFNNHQQAEFYFFRDSGGNEVDLIAEEKGAIMAYEIKSSQTFSKDFIKGLKKFKELVGDSLSSGAVIYAGDIKSRVDTFDVVPF